MDGGPDLSNEPAIPIGGPSVNPKMPIVPQKMIHTRVPMIDLFNCLVESQKIPIFSVAGEPYNQLLARIGIQADADIIVFGGLGLIFDDYYFFRTTFENEGILARTVMFVNQASDPIVERLLVPDMALKVAERFAVEEGKRVLVLLTDMTAYADALKEIGIAMERVPSNRGYMGDLYTQLAQRYERARDYKGAGSVTILTVTTMPGDDVTHPVPDNTGYITEGQLYLHNSVIDPFGSLSRLKQQVIGKVTREDHAQIMNTMIRFYSGAKEAEKKQAMASQGGLFALLGASEQNLSGLLQVESVEISEENLLGVRLPVLGEVRFHKTEYSMLAKPFWVDFLVELLQAMARLSIRRNVEQQRVRHLNEAVRRITQRVNLFEKVLIPQADKDIQRIRIYLADAERAAVVRSKIAKAKQQKAVSSQGFV